MAFYGESYAITSTSGIDYDSVFLHHDGLSATVAAGESFLVLSQADSLIWDDLTAATDVVVSWVVEVGPDSAGSLSCASGLDPTWDGTDPGYATEPAGTLTASGAGTLVFPQTIITQAALVDSTEAPVARFACESGTVDVQQVKLRVWPAAGAGGAWVEGPAYTVTRTPQRRSTFTVYTSGYFPDPADAWSDARAGIDAIIGENVLWGGDDLVALGKFTVAPDPGTLEGYQGQATFQTNIIYATRAAVSRFSVPLDAGVDPRETRYERTGSVRAAGDPAGAAYDAWTGWTPGSYIASDAGNRVGFESLGAEPTFDADDMAPFILPSGGAVISTGDPIPPPASPWFAFVVIPDGYLSYQGVTSDAGHAVPSTVFTFEARVSGYEWFDPTAVAQSPRFFVKDLDGVMRPVGFGKPSTETAVFRVPTAVGMYRDLTTTEYATYGPDSRPPGGYPLKVKRRDVDGADWWDHVGWMVPQTE